MVFAIRDKMLVISSGLRFLRVKKPARPHMVMLLAVSEGRAGQGGSWPREPDHASGAVRAVLRHVVSRRVNTVHATTTKRQHA